MINYSSTCMKPSVLLLISTLALAACSNEQEASTAPVAEKRPLTLEQHGDSRVEEYYWLRERENP